MVEGVKSSEVPSDGRSMYPSWRQVQFFIYHHSFMGENILTKRSLCITVRYELGMLEISRRFEPRMSRYKNPFANYWYIGQRVTHHTQTVGCDFHSIFITLFVTSTLLTARNQSSNWWNYKSHFCQSAHFELFSFISVKCFQSKSPSLFTQLICWCKTW